MILRAKSIFRYIACVLISAGMLAGALVLSGCDSSQTSSDSGSSGVAVRVASLKGPTSIGLASMMNEADQGLLSNAYTFTISGTADEITPALIQGKIDIALVPVNVASTLYSRTNGQISVISINTLGVQYVVSADDSIRELSDLTGRTVYMTGKGATTQYVMNYLLTQAGIAGQVTLDYRSEATEVAALLAANPEAVGVLPEPYVTAVRMKDAAIQPRISLVKEWERFDSSKESAFVTGVTIVRNAFLHEHEDIVQDFLIQQSASVEQAHKHPEEVAPLVVKIGILANEKAAQVAIPQCNTVCITGTAMKEAVSEFLRVLSVQDASSIGGMLPNDDFYYLGVK